MTTLATARAFEPIFCSVETAADLLATSKQSIYQLLDKGLIESRYQGRRRLVVVASLRDYANALPSVPEAS